MEHNTLICRKFQLTWQVFWTVQQGEASNQESHQGEPQEI